MKVPLLLILFSFISSSSPEDSSEAKLVAEIEALEKEKSNIYKQINEAIDESIKNLNESDDIDAQFGINLITGLKHQLKILNDTNNTEMYVDGGIDSSESVNDTRRRAGRVKLSYDDFLDHLNKKGARQKSDDVDDRAKKQSKFHQAGSNEKVKPDKEFEDKLLKRKELSKKYKDRWEGRERMRLRIEEWLAKKAEEKLKIKKYLNSSKKNREKCPRFGISVKDKKKHFKGIVPCCRKCCKASYLGCLK